MITARIKTMLGSSHDTTPLFPPTELYNEGWLLRLVLDWFSGQDIQAHPLSFPEDGRWFSEALLPTAFLPRYSKDPLGESWTHADGVIGHFNIGNVGKGDFSLSKDATHFVVLEAKMFSKLSSGVTHAKYFDQAARNVSCMAEILNRAQVAPTMLSRLSFHVLAPQSQIDRGVFDKNMSEESIRSKVERRIAEYQGKKDNWFKEWFQPTIEHVDIACISWEQLLSDVDAIDGHFSAEIHEFYERCLLFNSRPEQPPVKKRGQVLREGDVDK